ncbi:Hypothetical protein A7982_01449 [Minicystis rosea]|nr:Hypothetical protein A7982_01449 [Minicystis rosea]
MLDPRVESGMDRRESRGLAQSLELKRIAGASTVHEERDVGGRASRSIV